MGWFGLEVGSGDFHFVGFDLVGIGIGVGITVGIGITTGLVGKSGWMWNLERRIIETAVASLVIHC